MNTVNLNAGSTRMELAQQWAKRPDDERFLSVESLYESTKARRRSEYTIDGIHNLQLRPDESNFGILSGRSMNGDKVFTNWAFSQLAQRCGAPASFLRKLPANLAIDCLTKVAPNNSTGGWAKAYYSADTIYAVTSDTYGRIRDHEVVGAVMDVIESSGANWKVPGSLDWNTLKYNPHKEVTKQSTTLYASDRDVWMFLVDDTAPIQIGFARIGEPDYLFRGFWVCNSEVGANALKCGMFYLRGLCDNRIMWGVEGFKEISIRHTVNAPSKFAYKLIPMLREFAKSSEKRIIEGAHAAKAKKIDTEDGKLEEFLKRLGLTNRRVNDVMQVHVKEELRPIESLFDVANGISAVARDIPHTDERVEMEKITRQVLDMV